MLTPIFDNGNCVYESPSVKEIKEYCKQEKESLWAEYRRLTNPHIMKVDLSSKLYDLKQNLLHENGIENA